MLSHLVAIATPVITVLLLTAVGLDLKASDFRAVRERPALVAGGVALPMILLPLLAWLLVWSLRPAPTVASGLLLLSVSPMGGLATAYSMIARANAALSVTLAATACLAAVVTIPLTTAALGVLTGTSSALVAPLGVLARQVLLGLAPPVLLGMAIRARWPGAAERALPTVQRAAFVLLLTLVGLVLVDASGRPDVPWRAALSLAIAFLVGAFVTGIAAARLLSAPAADWFVLGVGFATRNVAVALAVAIALERQAEFLWFAAVYLVVQMPMLALAAALRARVAVR